MVGGAGRNPGIVRYCTAMNSRSTHMGHPQRNPDVSQAQEIRPGDRHLDEQRPASAATHYLRPPRLEGQQDEYRRLLQEWRRPPNSCRPARRGRALPIS
jgi:hypothetical protein